MFERFVCGLPTSIGELRPGTGRAASCGAGAGRHVAVVAADRGVVRIDVAGEAERGLEEQAEVILGRERREVVDLGEALLERRHVAADLGEARDDVGVGLPAVEHGAERRAAVRIGGDRLGAPAIVEVLDHRAMHREELEPVARVAFLEIRARLTDLLEPAARPESPSRYHLRVMWKTMW